MKKLCMILLTVCLMTTALAAAPGGEAQTDQPDQIIDLSGYEDEELVQLLAQVQAEVVARNIEKTASLPAGTYVFGQDIPAGKYLLAKDADDMSGIVNLSVADDPEGNHPSKLYLFISRDEAWEAYITGDAGDTLEIDFPCKLTISAGIRFQ